jgi:hypothetical protein
MLYDFNRYKLAKEYQEDCKTILKIVNLSITGLDRYKRYKPVAEILTELRNNKAILEAHLHTAKKVLKKTVPGGEQ